MHYTINKINTVDFAKFYHITFFITAVVYHRMSLFKMSKLQNVVTFYTNLSISNFMKNLFYLFHEM